MLRRAIFFVPFLLIAAAACTHPTTEEGDDEGASQDEVISAGMRARASDPCTATLVFLQKDAYKETAGRSSALWPAHTTTVLEVSCQTSRGEQRIAPYKENYGTKPGTKDANGDEILVKTEMDSRIVTTTAPWREMKNLVASYEQCDCDETKFLSMDKLTEQGKALAADIVRVLECPGGEDALRTAIEQSRFQEALGIVATCEVRAGMSVDVQAQVQKTFADQHVCNNVAVLQADLFARFRDHKDASACSASSKLCSGPKIFFDPKREIH
jgi:hypothetical protein